MLIDFESSGEVFILRLKGRFATGADSAYLRAKAAEVKASGPNKVLVDFRGVPYIDSTGISFVVGLYTSVVKGAEGRFALINLGNLVREALEITRLNTILPIYENEHAALAALTSPPETNQTAVAS